MVEDLWYPFKIDEYGAGWGFHNKVKPDMCVLGVEQKPKLVPARLGYKKYRHTGHNFHAEIRKNIFFLYIYSKSERRKSKPKNNS